MLNILYFASLREAVDCSKQTIVYIDGESVQKLLHRLAASVSDSEALLDSAIKVAINQQIVAVDTILNDGDEIAFFPPVTGG